ncbi:MAG TPA: hypothetical protein PKX92_06460 [Edaphocola sp.]|nr:hypothetical protein [Edaphocola sp.]
MKIIKTIFTCGLIMSTFTFVSAQQFNNSVLAAKASQFTQEVELNCPQYVNQDAIIINQQFLSRVEIKQQAYQSNEGFTPMSFIPLKNKCNPNLQRDENIFDPNTFNPLKYFFNFRAGVSTTYRVDNTNYIIVIHP